jgi:hypothetical protein
MPRTAQRPSLPGTDEMTLVSLFMRLFHTLIDDEPKKSASESTEALLIKL